MMSFQTLRIGEVMKQMTLLIAFVFISMSLTACQDSKKGNPQLVKDVQELVQLGCKCTDIECLHKVEVNGQSYAKIRLSPGAKDLKDDERMAFNLALGEWTKCELKLTQQ